MDNNNELQDYVKAITEKGFSVEVRDARTFRYNVEIKRDENLVYEFIVDRIQIPCEFQGKPSQRSLLLPEVRAKLEANAPDLPEAVKSELCIAHAATDIYLHRQKKNRETAEGIAIFNMQEIRSAYEKGALLDQFRGLEANLLNGSELNQLLKTDEYNKHARYAAIKLDAHSMLIIKEERGFESLSYRGRLACSYDNATVKQSVNEIAQLNAREIFDFMKVLEGGRKPNNAARLKK